MRSARTLLATAAASAVVLLGAPGAYAAGDDWDHEDSSYSKEHGKEYGDEHGKDHDKDHGKESRHDSPRGGMHTGGGALSAVTAPQEDHGDKDYGSGKHDEDSWDGKKEDSSGGKHEEDWGGKHEDDSWKGDHEKPKGGMHTGGGGLASPTVTAGGLAVLAVAGSGLYAARRKKSAGSVA